MTIKHYTFSLIQWKSLYHKLQGPSIGPLLFYNYTTNPTYDNSVYRDPCRHFRPHHGSTGWVSRESLHDHVRVTRWSYLGGPPWSPSGEWWAPHGAFESLGGDGWMGARQCIPHGGTSCVRGSSIGDTCWGRVWIGEFEVPSKSKKTLIGLGLVASSFNPLKESPTHQEHLSVYLNQNLEKEEHHGFHFRCNKQEEKKPRCFVIFFCTLSKLVLNE